MSADLSGTIDRIAFDSGKAVRAGEILVELDTRQERAQLAAADAQRELASVNFDRMQGLLKDNVISRAEYDNATADHKQMEARVGEIHAAIDRKTIRAPFSGILGIRQVNLGQYLSSGDPIVQLQAVNPIYVNFGVPQQAMAQVRVGREVRVTADDIPGEELIGRISAVDSIVNAQTRNIQAQATFANADGRLRPGMFVQTQLSLGSTRSVFPVPATAISYAPYGDSIFIVGDVKGADGATYKGVRQQFVKVEGARGDQVGVVSGLKDGDEFVTSGVFKLRNGVAVIVNNKVQPANNPAPKPEDN